MAVTKPGKLAVVFGGSGFVGRYVVRDLARLGWRVRAAVRRPELAGHLQPLGNVGQIRAVHADLRDPETIGPAVEHADVVINLVGILAERGAQTFQTVQGNGPRLIAEAARAAGLSRIIQVSAIGADPHSRSFYARSKASGEAGVREVLPDSIIVRPSIVFGAEDQFFNRFARIAQFSPVVPVVGAHTRFQPVFVGDVGAFIAAAAEEEVVPGETYELGGPEIRNFHELIELMLEQIDRKRMILPISFATARAQAGLMRLLPNPPLTTDQIELLATDNVVSEEAKAEKRTFEAAGIQPHTLEAILPTYLWLYRSGGQFARVNKIN